MSKVTITITDLDDKEGVNLTMESDPPIDMEDKEAIGTQAQFLGCRMMEYVVKNMGWKANDLDS